MSSAKTARFAKTRGCPSAEMLELNIYAEGSAQMSELLASHLANCDFCCAEAYFLAKHKNRSTVIEAPPMPGPLRLLAEALLKRGVDRDRFEFGEARG